MDMWYVYVSMDIGECLLITCQMLYDVLCICILNIVSTFPIKHQHKHLSKICLQMSALYMSSFVIISICSINYKNEETKNPLYLKEL